MKAGEPVTVEPTMEYAPQVIHSIVAGTPRTIYGNVSNTGLISNLRPAGWSKSLAWLTVRVSSRPRSARCRRSVRPSTGPTSTWPGWSSRPRWTRIRGRSARPRWSTRPPRPHYRSNGSGTCATTSSLPRQLLGAVAEGGLQVGAVRREAVEDLGGGRQAGEGASTLARVDRGAGRVGGTDVFDVVGVAGVVVFSSSRGPAKCRVRVRSARPPTRPATRPATPRRTRAVDGLGLVRLDQRRRPAPTSAPPHRADAVPSSRRPRPPPVRRPAPRPEIPPPAAPAASVSSRSPAATAVWPRHPGHAHGFRTPRATITSTPASTASHTSATVPP